jgi:Na+/melibiose symporter-like transporter
MGLIFITTRVIDAIQDPVIGLISDKFTHRGPRGRLTFVALMLPLLIGGFYMLFHPPESLFTQPVWLATWLFVALFVVHLGYAGVSISYHAHGAELTDDYNERTRVTVGREVFGLIGMTLAVVLPTYFTAQMGEHAGYVYMGLIFIPIAVLFSLPTLLWSPPSVHPPVVRENPEIHVRYFRDWLTGLMPWLARPTRNMERSTTVKTLIPFFAPLKNKLFRRLLLVFIVNGAALGVAVSVMLFYVEHVLKGNKLQAGIILLVYFGAAAASVPLWMLLSRRFSKTAAWFIAMVLTAVSMSFGVFLGAGDFVWFMPIAIITGLGRLRPAAVGPGRHHQFRRGQGHEGRHRRLFRPVGAVDQAGDGHRRGRLAARRRAAGVQSFPGALQRVGADLRLYRRSGRHQDHRRAAHLVHPDRGRPRVRAGRAPGTQGRRDSLSEEVEPLRLAQAEIVRLAPAVPGQRGEDVAEVDRVPEVAVLKIGQRRVRTVEAALHAAAHDELRG